MAELFKINIELMRNKKFKVIFLGSDEIAIPSLNFLHNDCKGTDICAVLTQPDRRVGRGRKVKPNSIKLWAADNDIPHASPEIPNTATYEWLKEFKADLILVMAYGHILKESFLDLSSFGCFNLHASILPSYRGASPIETAIAMGDKLTGVTLMKVFPKMDAGPILDVERVIIDKSDTGLYLRNKISLACVPLLERNISIFAEADKNLIPQNEKMVSYCRKLTKEDGNLDFFSSASHLADRIRAFQSWPGCNFKIANEKIRIGNAKVITNNLSLKEGETTKDEKGNLLIGTSEGILIPKSMQRPGGKMLDSLDFLRGFDFPFGSTLISSKMEDLLVRK